MIYQVPTPCMYLYFARQTKNTGAAQQRSFDEVALHQLITFAVAMIICVSRSGTFIVNFQDDRLRRSMGGRLKRSRTVIGVINPIVGGALQKSDALGFRNFVARMETSARNHLVLQTIL